MTTIPNHPLTEDRAAEIWGDHAPAYLGQWRSMSDDRRAHAVHLLRVAHNAGREYERATNPEDDRPWEPLDGPVRVGDEVRQNLFGVTRAAVVARVDRNGNPRSSKGGLIGLRDSGTWYVRRAAPTLPTEDGAVIMYLSEVEVIRAVDDTGRLNDFHRLTYDAGTETWYGMDLDGHLRWTTSQKIVRDTWKADDQ